MLVVARMRKNQVVTLRRVALVCRAGRASKAADAGLCGDPAIGAPSHLPGWLPPPRVPRSLLQSGAREECDGPL